LVRIEKSHIPPTVAALLAILLRLGTPAAPGAAEPWLAGAAALQGISSPGQGGIVRSDLLISVPLWIVQNVAYLAARAAGNVTGMSAAAWIGSHPELGTSFLRMLWILAAGAAAALAARLFRHSTWSWTAGVLVAIAPIGLVGTQRLEPWALGACFLLAALSPTRRALGVLCWSFALTLSPLVWIAAACGIIAGGRERRLHILFALPIWLGMTPAYLLAPLDTVRHLPTEIATAGWPGWRDGPIAANLVAGWAPGIAALILGALAWLRRGRAQERALLCAVALLWIIPSLLGARRPEAVGLIAPAAIVAGVFGAQDVCERARRNRGWVEVALVAVLLLPGVVFTARTVRALGGRRDSAQEVARLIEREVGKSGLLARDPDAAIAVDSLAGFTLPKNAMHADTWDFAWWPGWYGDFTHFLVSARAVEEIERDPTARPVGRMMLAALTRHATRVATIGDPITERSAVILFRLNPGAPWQVADRAAAWKTSPGTAEAARFVGDLAAYLTKRGKTESSVELFRLALAWDDSNPRLWNNLGSNLLLMHESKEAADAFTEGLRRNPTSVELRYGLARAYLQAKIPGRAEVELRRVLAANPSFAAAHYELARIAAANGNWAEAALALENYLANEPDPQDRAAVETALAEARRRAAVRR
jgi:tetratricopeptide (TPR) repeat protein